MDRTFNGTVPGPTLRRTKDDHDHVFMFNYNASGTESTSLITTDIVTLGQGDRGIIIFQAIKELELLTNFKDSNKLFRYDDNRSTELHFNSSLNWFYMK
jgi:hypothetical protein